MKCPKCKQGKVHFLPPPPESIDENVMGYCDNMECDYMGEGRGGSSPEQVRDEFEFWKTLRSGR